MKIDSEELSEAIEAINSEVPYAVPGRIFTYNDYHKGWYECCRTMGEWLERKEKEL